MEKRLLLGEAWRLSALGPPPEVERNYFPHMGCHLFRREGEKIALACMCVECFSCGDAGETSTVQTVYVCI